MSFLGRPMEFLGAEKLQTSMTPIRDLYRRPRKSFVRPSHYLLSRVFTGLSHHVTHVHGRAITQVRFVEKGLRNTLCSRKTPRKSHESTVSVFLSRLEGKHLGDLPVNYWLNGALLVKTILVTCFLIHESGSPEPALSHAHCRWINRHGLLIINIAQWLWVRVHDVMKNIKSKSCWGI